jgi:hypothetical protein
MHRVYHLHPYTCAGRKSKVGAKGELALLTMSQTCGAKSFVGRRLRAFGLVLGSCATLVAVFGWGTAHASTSHDLRGTFAVVVCPGQVSGTCTLNKYPQTWTITSEDLNSGAFSGTGVGTGEENKGQKFTVSGTISGETLNVTGVEGSYTSNTTATISADNNSFTGTYSDSSGGKGVESGTRTSGPPPPTSGPPAPTTPSPTPTPKLGESELLRICVGLYTNECSGFPKPEVIRTCVSLYENCNGFGGTKPAEPGTIDLSGLPAPTPNSVATPATCKAPAKKANATARIAEEHDPRDTCLIKAYVETNDPVAKAKFDHELNAEQFKLEVEASKSNILLGAIGACRNIAKGCPYNPDAVKSYNALAKVLAIELAPSFDAIARPGKPVETTSISLGRFCTIYPDVSDQNHCREELETPINEALQKAATELGRRKEELGLHVPFTPPAAKGSAYAAASKRRGSHRLVLLDGFAELRPGHTGSLRLNFPRKLRLALKQALRHRTIHAVLVTDGSDVAGIDTIHRVHVRLRMH